MFEEICLVCGRHLLDDGRVYCSDDCQSLDMTSPSISSASSALSSPHLGHTLGGDVPALVPSALGSALKTYWGRDRVSVSSSSASSTSWSVLTDDDEDDAGLGVGSEYDGTDSVYEGSTKSANLAHSMGHSALSYARRPSGTNNRSTVPNLHRRTSSGSPSSHVRGIPSSAPNHSHSSTEDEDYSDFGFSSRYDLDGDEPELHQARAWGSVKAKSTLTKPKRNRNRASLPAYFSLLQISSPSNENKSPVSSSSVHTISRPSPPTPKLTLTGLAAGLPHSATTTSITSIHATPRGRRKIPGSSESHQRSEHSDSTGSLSRPSTEVLAHTGEPSHRVRLDSRGSVEQVFDWSVMDMPRGRTAVRRNSSPPPKMMLSAIALEDHNRAIAAAKKAEATATSQLQAKTRGRARVEELDGLGLSAYAPGYGHGRSGLLDRARINTEKSGRLV
ncbi:hypothetical protein BD779DRAFT_1670869 [Infundibulicybe gibba]|nr:hypothetical protein BD779DRAFT_1670869 [Infundibulicybe gibba]